MPSDTLGAVIRDGGVDFGVWAPAAKQVEVEILSPGSPRLVSLAAMDGGDGNDGYFSALVPGLGAGTRYRFRLDGEASYPDPRSRHQPEGPHGPSEVVDLGAFRWTDGAWRGISADGLVVYELHVGTYTPEGTFEAIIPHLSDLRDLGATAIELMPVAEFPGERGWGYDGVDLFAPHHVYGGPRGLQSLVDAAHAVGLGVMLDVVYNHFGPSGNYLRAYSPDYFTDRHHTPWGEAINYDGPNSGPVRRYVLDDVAHWIGTYHLDGLRLDATHEIKDDSRPHILEEIGRVARTSAGGRSVVVVAESDRNDVRWIDPPERGGYGLDAVWADDFHHAVHTLLTGERDGYYEDYSARAGDIARVVRAGFLYQGQESKHLGRPRGVKVTDQTAPSFVFCLENHDQVGNRALGEPLHKLVGLDLFAAALPLLLLAPETPLLFQGQEFASSAPFLYFSDHEPELGRAVTRGRREEFGKFASFADPEAQARIPDPQARRTFLQSKVPHSERDALGHRRVLAIHRALLRLRREDPVFAHQSRTDLATDSRERAVFVRRWHGDEERLVLANLGEAPLRLADWPELLREAGGDWGLLLSTDDSKWDAGDGSEAGSPPGGAAYSLSRGEIQGARALVLGRSKSRG